MNHESTLGLTWLTDARLEEEIRCASQTDARVMITGESGVGKRFAADMIHQLSRRRRAPFVAVNGTDLVETGSSEPGAIREFHQGLLQTANHGTLLIQEIENVPESSQSQFLRFIDRTTAEGNDVRLMTSTSVPLVERVQTGEFRDDLFYRLNLIHVVIPPLRDRPEDIPVMFHYYLSLHSRAEIPELSSAARQRLVEYAWPGNVRELKTVTKKLCAQDLPKLIEPEHLPCPIGG